METPKNRVLKLRKRVGDKIVRWGIEIDAAGLILHEGPISHADPNEAIRADWDRRGIQYEVHGKSLLVTSIPIRESVITNFFLEGAPCPYPDCEALRAQYLAEIGNLPADCADCSQGQIMAKYRAMVERLVP